MNYEFLGKISNSCNAVRFFGISMTNYKYLMLNNIYNPARTKGRTFNMILPAGGETEYPILYGRCEFRDVKETSLIVEAQCNC